MSLARWQASGDDGWVVQPLTVQNTCTSNGAKPQVTPEEIP